MCNMLCLPDCMFADDAAQSIIAFLTVVCRHTGGRYIAPEVSMHNTRRDPHTNAQQPLVSIHNCFQPQVYTMLLQGTRDKQVIKHVFATPSIQSALLIYSLKRSFVLTFGCNRSIFLLLMGSSPYRKPSRVYSEPQALPSLVVADCCKSPNK